MITSNKSLTLKSQNGFSLIELMVVVSIIGILAAVAIPNFNNMQAKARQSSAKSILSGIYMAEKLFVSDWATYIGDFRSMGYCPEGNMDYRFGFTAAGAVHPAAANGYPPLGIGGGPAPGGASVMFASNSANWAGPAAGAACISAIEGTRAVAAGALAGGVVPSNVAFTAVASSNLDADTGLDTWTINQANALVNTVSDL